MRAMPRAIPPVSLCPLPPELPARPDEAREKIADIASLHVDDRRKIAAAVGLQDLTPDLTPSLLSTIEAGIYLYKLQSRLPAVTAEQNIAAIDAALAALKTAEGALLPFIDVLTSGVGGPTARALNPPALDVKAAISRFREMALSRKEYLLGLPSPGIRDVPLAWLGSLARFCFESAMADIDAATDKERLRTFAIAVFKAAGFHCEIFDWHRGRVDKYLGGISFPEILLADKIRHEVSIQKKTGS
jgi:hypothetical protein